MILTDIDRAYIAGFLDGEGSICIYALNKRTTRAGQMKVVLSNTNKDVLEFVKLHYGGSIYLAYRNNKPKAKPVYQWTVVSQQALSFLLEIEPYLKMKKLQAQTAIEYQGQRRGRGSVLTEAEAILAETQMGVMKQLNKKGVRES